MIAPRWRRIPLVLIPLGIILVLVFGSVRPVPVLAATLEARVAATHDDARSLDSGGFTATEISALVGVGNGAPNVNGYRFTGLAIPRGATIDAVAFSLVKQGTEWSWLQVDLAFEASDSAAGFSRAAPPLQRPRTATRASVSDNVQRLDGTRYTIGDPTTLAAALQEIVDRPNWQPGNSVALIAYGEATTTWARQAFATYDAGAERAPQLAVNYRPLLASTPTGTAPPASPTGPPPATPPTPAPPIRPSATPTPVPSSEPTLEPSPAPTSTPTLTPTPLPLPTFTPMPMPTTEPTPSAPIPTPSVVPTSTPSAEPAPGDGAGHEIVVGPGYSDVSPHQLVRTSGDVLFAVVATCDGYPSCPGSTLRIYRADRPGTPATFTERDAAHRPAGSGAVAVAVDGQDRIQVLWNDRDGLARYAIFDTAADGWGPVEVIAATNWTTFGQGDEGVALALDAAGTPHAAWNVRGGDGMLQIYYARRLGNGWTAPIRADDVALAPNHSAWHPTLAFTPVGDLLLAWLDGSFNYTPDGTIRTRVRAANGSWSDSQAIPDSAMTAIDNGPSLIVTPDGTRHLAFLDTGDAIRYWYDAGQGWRGDRQTARQVTHDPALGPDGAGGVYLYGHGTPQGGLDGHGDNLYRFRLAAGATDWGPWTLYTSGSFDASVSTRWSQFFHHNPDRVDIIYWSDPYPNILYAGTD